MKVKPYLSFFDNVVDTAILSEWTLLELSLNKLTCLPVPTCLTTPWASFTRWYCCAYWNSLSFISHSFKLLSYNKYPNLTYCASSSLSPIQKPNTIELHIMARWLTRMVLVDMLLILSEQEGVLKSVFWVVTSYMIIKNCTKSAQLLSWFLKE